MTKTSFTTPIEDRYFEDYVPGQIHEFGSIKIEEAEMIHFATRFDPQPFHTNPEEAKESIFGRLIASGWLTVGLMMRLLVEYYIPREASLVSPGVDEVRWPKPVYPADVLSIRVTVLRTKRSSSKPDRGIVRSFVEALNQHGEVVMTMKTISLIACREPVVKKKMGPHKGDNHVRTSFRNV